MQFVQAIDAGMRRAVQQESRSLSSGLAKHQTRRKRQQGKGCLLLIMLTPITLVLCLLYILSIYNDMVHYEEQQQKLLQSAEQAEAGYLPEQEAQLLRKRQADAARLAARDVPSELILTTKLGEIHISLRSDLSAGSVDYLRRLIDSKVCRRCNLYRAEKPGILQGIMANPHVPTNTELGSCPPDAESIPNSCPKWDSSCACHGPLMTRGSVAWAAGQAGGPDFFIDAYKKPATWWGTQHTNFGFIDDPKSMELVDQILNSPVTENGGMHHLQEPIHFDMSLL